MAEFQIGAIVKSINGHDRGFFAVVKTDSKFVYLADGRSRLLEKPKKKNSKHIRVTGVVLDQMRIETNKKLRAALWPYSYGEQQATDD